MKTNGLWTWMVRQHIVLLWMDVLQKLIGSNGCCVWAKSRNKFSTYKPRPPNVMLHTGTCSHAPPSSFMNECKNLAQTHWSLYATSAQPSQNVTARHGRILGFSLGSTLWCTCQLGCRLQGLWCISGYAQHSLHIYIRSVSTIHCLFKWSAVAR